MPAREYNKASQRTLTASGFPFVPEILQSNIVGWQMAQSTTYSVTSAAERRRGAVS
jgi:hypothetical protein